MHHWTRKKEMEWAFLAEPAPQLHKIRILTSRWQNHMLPSCLFADDAPQLKDFSIFQMEYEFPKNASWLQNLTCVSFSEAFTTEKVLTALQGMPKLVSLAISLGSRRQIHQGLAPKVVLPKLRMLEMYGEIINATTILKSITPLPDCCLCTPQTRRVGFGSLTLTTDDNDLYEQYEQAVKPYIFSYFSLYPPSSMVFYLTPYTSQGYPVILNLMTSRVDRWGRSFNIALDVSFLPTSSLMKELVTSTWISHVDTFGLWLHGSLLHRVDFLADDSVNGIISAMAAFSSSATAFQTDEYSLRRLVKPAVLSIASATLFPALTTLEIACPPMRGRAPDEEEPAHHEFLKLRRQIGRPISVLDLSTLSDEVGDMSYLEEHTGLLVRWKTDDGRTREYICGEGHPERLCFSGASLD
ncbi:hypothetical protein D9613_004446 [Agrocybe pediades]|uniref:Uncharacterized protein n=1 Tax=Agrocybe pediades TaxID=84607 RepID=A0A8H4QJ08_9AGAR|nr:hypothetical protein D9613_004446 [Agrocybe pediades]